jgi:predicted TIM-barrel fold metal-dependent hydrolase
MDNFVLTGKEGVWALEDSLGVSCSTLGRYVDAVAQRVAAFKEQGAKGLKLALAYKRDLHFAPRTEAEAEGVYLRILEEGYGWRPHGVGFEEARPLQDYLVHRLCEIAADLELPVVIHGAMQANNYHNADDARPARLWNLVHRHRRTTFVLLHAGFPWFEDAAQLAKHYPNLYLDMTWTYLMSPAISQRGLEMFVDLVPRNKVLGFGGDYAVVENVYGHLVMARETIARALASHVEQHGMPMERARGWARALLHDNPADLYRID